MVGVFVQVNVDSIYAKSNPIGYVIAENGCELWTGGGVDGYGTMRDPVTSETVRAHRWRWEQRYGKIPEGYECHHVCADRLCTNPEHLEIVTPKEHFDRDVGMQYGQKISRPKATKASAISNLARTHDKHGHPLYGTNVYIAPSGYRHCRICRAERKEEYLTRQRNASLSGEPHTHEATKGTP